MKLRVPTKTSICGHDVSIIYKIRVEQDDVSLAGAFEFSSGDIQVSLSEHETLDEVWDTILHELLHAAFHYTGSGNLLGSMEKEECVVEMLEKNFFKFTRPDKRKFKKYVELDFNKDN